MSENISALQKARASYAPKLPDVLKDGSFRLVEHPIGLATSEFRDQIAAQFPHTVDKPLMVLEQGEGDLRTDKLTLGVVFSGGQAPGGHNVIAGLLDALKAANPESELLGFLGGPIGVIKGNYRELTPDVVQPYRNTGGFDLIGSGRDKIDSPEDLKACRENLTNLGVQGLVIIGGDDSNTNAAVLAEYLMSEETGIQVIGVPKTIDGDMKNDCIEASFGFDTAARVFSELVGSICRDSMSAGKYFHFIRLMGRAASHITLEVALQTHPNLAVISEEAEARGMTLSEVVDRIVDVVCRRAESGKNYGVVIIPEGLLEFLSDFKTLISELGAILGKEETYINSLPDQSERAQFLTTRLSPESGKVYNSLPISIQDTLLRRDSHGNIPLSQVDTETLLIDLVSDKLRHLKSTGDFRGKFSPLGHFFGYEGRCVAPSNFDSDYCYSLGYTAAQLIRGGLSGYTVSATNLAAPAGEWVMGGVPVASMLTMEERKGKLKAVIRKTLVDCEGPAFKEFDRLRDSWVVEDCYTYPGPIQYWGPPEVADALTCTLKLERG